MQRSITPVGLMLTSVSAIIGSGWLFSAYYSAKLAGPAAIFSWILGGLAVILVACVFAELCATLPITGSSTRIPRFTHGTIASFLFSWIIWLSYAAFAPTETQAVIQYLRFYYPSIASPTGALTSNGYILATVLMFAINAINFYSVRWLIRVNSFLTVLKLIIPTFMALVLLVVYFTATKEVTAVTTNLITDSFMPFGTKGIFYALAVGGIVFSFNGFKQAAEMAGEAKNPSFALPFAIVGSVVVCLVIFLLLQTALLSAIIPENIKNGWGNLDLPGGTSPFVALFYQRDVRWVMPVLYFGAIVAPLAAGLMYVGSAARSLYGISKGKQLPSFLQIMNTHGNPVYAMLLNFCIGMLMFAPLPGWDKMVAFLTSLITVTYSIGPINLLALREQLPDHARPFRLPFVKIWALISFYICNLLTYWTGWETVSKMGLAMGVGLAILLAYKFFSKEARDLKLDWYPATWLWPYFIGLTALSYLSSFGGGIGVIPFGWDFAVMAVFSFVVMQLAMKFKLPSAVTQKYVAEALEVKPVVVAAET